jgi:hypothetical protein
MPKHRQKSAAAGKQEHGKVHQCATSLEASGSDFKPEIPCVCDSDDRSDMEEHTSAQLIPVEGATHIDI